MLRVLYLPIGSQTGMVDAWNNVGVELNVYDFFSAWEHGRNKHAIAQEFITRVGTFQPDLIFMQLQLTGIIDPSVIMEARRIVPDVVIANWTGDVRGHASGEFVQISKVVDYPLISSTGQLEMYRSQGSPNVKYWQIGYDPKTLFPKHKNEFRYDVSFLGNNYGHTFPDGNLRLGVANQLRNTFGARFGLFGSGYHPPAPSVDPSEANNIYNDSICALSISNFNNVSHYFSDRLLHCLASGRPTICWYFPGCESYFVDGQEIFMVKSNKEISDIVHYCKENPEIATQIGINGYQRVVREHTFTSRIIEFLHMSNLISKV